MERTTKLDRGIEGRRVRLVHTNDEWTRLRPGTEGTVTFIDSVGTVHVAWDDGSGLGLVDAAGDRYELLPPETPTERAVRLEREAGVFERRADAVASTALARRHRDSAAARRTLARQARNEAAVEKAVVRGADVGAGLDLSLGVGSCDACDGRTPRDDLGSVSSSAGDVTACGACRAGYEPGTDAHRAFRRAAYGPNGGGLS